jgi:site-specific DNA-methyltransferase (adenine-specific)
MEHQQNEIYNIDCLEGMQKISSETIDMILCDPPYGLTECKWDVTLNMKSMFDEYKRIIKPDGAIVIFSQQPYTSKLILNCLELFKYSMVWRKSRKGNFAQAPYRFMSEHEDILVFSKGKTAKNGIPRMKYNPQGVTTCNKAENGKKGRSEHRRGRKEQNTYIQSKTGYPGTILEFKNESGFHPTQKPVLLCEYLIKSFSNEGDLVLDNCMGSGTTAIACLKSKRHYIGFETDITYFEKSKERIRLLEETLKK